MAESKWRYGRLVAMAPEVDRSRPYAEYVGRFGGFRSDEVKARLPNSYAILARRRDDQEAGSA